MSSKTAIIHIGLPKTGSTSLQEYMVANRRHLRRSGFDLFDDDFFGQSTHTGLHFSVLRSGVETFSTIKYSDCGQDEVRQATAKAIGRFFRESRHSNLIFSSEGLSFLRTVEECRRLRDLFPVETTFRIVLAIRDKDEWLKSYTKQIYKVPGRSASSDPRSALYVRTDTWLTDFEQIVKVYTAVFGEVEIVPYESEDMVKAMLSRIGINNVRQLAKYRLNVTEEVGSSNHWPWGFQGAARRVARFLGDSKARKILQTVVSKVRPK